MVHETGLMADMVMLMLVLIERLAKCASTLSYQKVSACIHICDQLTLCMHDSGVNRLSTSRLPRERFMCYS